AERVAGPPQVGPQAPQGLQLGLDRGPPLLGVLEHALADRAGLVDHRPALLAGGLLGLVQDLGGPRLGRRHLARRVGRGREAHLLLELRDTVLELPLVLARGHDLARDALEEVAHLRFGDAVAGTPERSGCDLAGCEPRDAGRAARAHRARSPARGDRVFVSHPASCYWDDPFAPAMGAVGGGVAGSGSPPALRSACNASSSVRTLTTFIPSACAFASASSSGGTSISVAPAERAATAFCSTPPTGPTLPSGEMVPVIATRRPPVRSPGVRSSMI